MSLAKYRSMRDFSRTEEPRGKASATPKRLSLARSPARSFVIQKHAARRLHYDFRLELDGELLSWAVPKGPSENPADKRLAVEVEPHPLEYGKFEGTIPQGEYGAGLIRMYPPVGMFTNEIDVRKRGQSERDTHAAGVTGRHQFVQGAIVGWTAPSDAVLPLLAPRAAVAGASA